MDVPRKIAVIACGVLEWNIDRLVADLDNVEVVKKILPAQLHQNPRKLRQLLQDEIDRLEQDREVEAIALGFGVCGRGTISLTARSKPLVIPKTQDCIGISLGSHARYMEQFRRKPGTRYMTQGWYEKTVLDKGDEDYMSKRDRSLYGPIFEDLSRQYGEENARYICEFRNSWQRNYQRSAYIRFKGEQDLPPGQNLSRATAESLDWDDEVLEGDESLLAAMLSGRWQDPRLLLVPPFCKTVSAPGGAVIAFTSGAESHVAELLAKYRQSKSAKVAARSGIGLGIDTGGTFTDAVIYSFDEKRVLASAKAPTIHENLVQGIREAMQKLPPAVLARVERVGISTTLATNAFVEKKGRPVALLVMSPMKAELEDFPFRYVRRISGIMSMEGLEIQAVDETQVAHEVQKARTAGCEAFAISGFAGVVNPAHELQVAKIAFRETGMHAVCGHQLTSNLNFVERATTASMNAKLIPLIENLLDAVDKALAENGLQDVQVMVVKGDGSQMLDVVAKEFPVETLLSGPAASVVGAASLFEHETAVVVDMGGTTLDTAVFRDRLPVRSEQGARIGEFQTSVRAMEVHTIGLGGDSEIDFSEWPKVTIGPRRIVPLCRMTQRYPGTKQLIDQLPERFIGREKNCLDFIGPVSGTEKAGAELLKHLSSEPILLYELADRLQRPGPRFIRWEELESAGAVQRYGLTITDILHIQKQYNAFDRSASVKVLDFWAELLNADPNELIDAVHHEFRRMTCQEVLGAALPESTPWKKNAEFTEWLTGELTADRESGLAGFRIRLDCPVIAVGAPTPALFPQLAHVFNQQVLISEHAAVANAVGAIAGDVLLQHEAAIRITEEGVFVCSWRGGSERCTSLIRALQACEQGLYQVMKADAEANAIAWREPTFTAVEQKGETKDGTVFLGVRLSAELKG